MREFWSKVQKTKSCWLWTGACFQSGYGVFKGKRAHRVAWTLSRGSIPAGKKVLHHCDIRNCVRPSHLYLGTPKQNSQDWIQRGRGRSMTLVKANQLRRLSKRLDPKSLAEKFRISLAAVYRILRGAAWNPT